MKRRVWIWMAVALLSVQGVEAADDLAPLLGGMGVWVQSPRTLTPEKVSALSEYGFSRIHLMATDPQEKTPTACKDDRRSTATASEAHLGVLAKSARDHGFRVIATYYVYPRKSEIEALTAPESGPIAKLIAAGAESIEFDLEGQWSKHPACGYKDHGEALKALVDRTKDLKDGLSVGVTTHTGRFKDERIDLSLVDYLSLQAYSRCKPGDCPDWDSRGGPGRKQEEALEDLAKLEIPSIIGLAAYQQVWKGRTVAEAMGLARDAADQWIASKKSRVVGISYWSSLWILKADGAEGAFLKGRTKTEGG